jgi:hypothetical protein
MPTPKQLANLKQVGRPPTNNSSLTLTIDNDTLAIVDRIAKQQGWKRSKVIEIYLKKAFGRFEVGGYDLDDLELIAKAAPIE